jgi:hypothetical protein
MKGHRRVALLDLELPALAGKPASDRLADNTTVAKIVHCGKNKITESVPVHGFGLGPNKAKAKRWRLISLMDSQMQSPRREPQSYDVP